MTERADQGLKPESWEHYVGQEKLKTRLRIAIDGARQREEPLGHVLLCGGSGCGKTSLAALIAEELGVPFHAFTMPLKAKSLQRIFADPNFEGVVFLDELHRSKRSDQEVLLEVLEESKITKDNGTVIKIEHPLTVIAATTDKDKLQDTIRNRFDHQPKFEPYTDQDMAVIVKRMADKLGIPMSEKEAKALGRASAGIPRQGRILVRTARDLGTCDPEEVLRTCGITADGLTEEHIEYLKALDTLGQLAGVDHIANLTGQPKEIIKELEKLLINKRLIEYTPKGRALMTKGIRVIREVNFDW